MLQEKGSSQISHLSIHIKNLGKEEINKKQVIGKKIKTKEKKKKKQKNSRENHESKNLFFEEINEINKPLARLTGKKVRRHKLPYQEYKKGHHNRPHTIKWIIRLQYKQFYGDKIDNLDKVV